MRAPRRLLLLAVLALVLAPAAHASPRFDVQKTRLVLTEPGYRLTIDRHNGTILDLFDRAANARVLGELGCLWGANPVGDPDYVGGCLARRFAFHWARGSSTLTLAWVRPDSSAIVTLAAGANSFDLRLALVNHRGRTIEKVVFPADLFGDTRTVEAGYAPNFLPGVELAPPFFSRVGNNVLTYPSRWAFADFLALDIAGSHVALYSVNPPPSPLAPAELGFTHNDAPAGCSGRTFCLTHAYDTWIADGAKWTSPVVRVRVGEPVEQSILDYRRDNGIDAYPSLAAKLGPRLDTLVRAPLIKADLWKGLHPFREWGPDLKRLPSPALLHPVAYQLHGHDESDPDFLPPDPIWGTTADFRAAVEQAQSLGLAVMPYLNVSWWNLDSQTTQALPSVAAAAAQDAGGHPLVDRYGQREGYAVSPYAPVVRQRVADLLEQWRTEVPADCLFFDQIGARPWRYDFNPASPTPLAYDDGWLELLAPYADRCLMVEDGWDRLAQSAAGFHGSALMMERENGQPHKLFGAGNWKPYPLATWLLHDKVLMYQHDLYEGTFATDAEALTWDLAFGTMLSYSWDPSAGSLDSPWLGLVGAFQKALGPRFAGQQLTGWRDVTSDVTESVYGDFHVLANWSHEDSYSTDGYALAPLGFFARGQGVLAGEFAGSFDGAPLSPGTHFVLVESGANGVTVRQPVGDDTELTVEASSAQVTAYAPSGIALGAVPARLAGGRVSFHYAATFNASAVAYYRIG